MAMRFNMILLFNYPGMGRLIFTAATQKDFPLLQSSVTITAQGVGVNGISGQTAANEINYDLANDLSQVLRIDFQMGGTGRRRHHPPLVSLGAQAKQHDEVMGVRSRCSVAGRAEHDPHRRASGEVFRRRQDAGPVRSTTRNPRPALVRDPGILIVVADRLHLGPCEPQIQG